MAEIGELPAKRPKYAAEDSLALSWSLLRKGELQVALADPSQASMQKVNRVTDTNADEASQAQRKKAQNVNDQPYWRILEFVAHQGQSDGSIP